MTDTIKIPAEGRYIAQNGMKWHISICGGDLIIRLVEYRSRENPVVCMYQPARNTVEIFPWPDP